MKFGDLFRSERMSSSSRTHESRPDTQIPNANEGKIYYSLDTLTRAKKAWQRKRTCSIRRPLVTLDWCTGLRKRDTRDSIRVTNMDHIIRKLCNQDGEMWKIKEFFSKTSSSVKASDKCIFGYVGDFELEPNSWDGAQADQTILHSCQVGLLIKVIREEMHRNKFDYIGKFYMGCWSGNHSHICYGIDIRTEGPCSPDIGNVLTTHMI